MAFFGEAILPLRRLSLSRMDFLSAGMKEKWRRLPSGYCQGTTVKETLLRARTGVSGLLLLETTRSIPKILPILDLKEQYGTNTEGTVVPNFLLYSPSTFYPAFFR